MSETNEPEPTKTTREPRRTSARDAVLTVFLAMFLLLIVTGQTIKSQGEQLQNKFEHNIVVGVGKPAAWIADQLPFSKPTHKLTADINPDGSLGNGPGFDQIDKAGGAAGAVAPVTPDAFDPTALGQKAAAPVPLKHVLVTGDSMSQGLDAEIARTLAGTSVKTTRDPHVGTGISETDLVDWSKLSRQQVAQDKPDAIVMFMGANEGFPMDNVDCCGPKWAAIYATRARVMMNTFRQAGKAKIYWLLLPAPRDPARQKISRVVNQALITAASPYRAQIRILDMNAVFTPGGKWRSSMNVDGSNQIVRKPDGIHLNDEGAKLASKLTIASMKRDFTFG